METKRVISKDQGQKVFYINIFLVCVVVVVYVIVYNVVVVV